MLGKLNFLRLLFFYLSVFFADYTALYHNKRFNIQHTLTRPRSIPFILLNSCYYFPFSPNRTHSLALFGFYLVVIWMNYAYKVFSELIIESNWLNSVPSWDSLHTIVRCFMMCCYWERQTANGIHFSAIGTVETRASTLSTYISRSLRRFGWRFANFNSYCTYMEVTN